MKYVFSAIIIVLLWVVFSMYKWNDYIVTSNDILKKENFSLKEESVQVAPILNECTSRLKLEKEENERMRKLLQEYDYQGIDN